VNAVEYCETQSHARLTNLTTYNATVAAASRHTLLVLLMRLYVTQAFARPMQSTVAC